MPLSHPEIIRILLGARSRLLAAGWVVVRDAHHAEDLFQTMSVKALGPGLEFESETALMAWAHVVIRRDGIALLRKRKREHVGFDQDVLDLMDQHWREQPAGQDRKETDALRECLDTLPPKSRLLIEMRYFKDQTCAEVARSLGCAIDAVYQRLSRLQRALRDCVNEKINPAGAS